MDGSPQKTKTDLLKALVQPALSEKREKMLCDPFVKCCLRQHGIWWNELRKLIPKNLRAATVQTVINHLEQERLKTAA
jgi:hypothetical protein